MVHAPAGSIYMLILINALVYYNEYLITGVKSLILQVPWQFHLNALMPLLRWINALAHYNAELVTGVKV